MLSGPLSQQWSVIIIKLIFSNVLRNIFINILYYLILKRTLWIWYYFFQCHQGSSYEVQSHYSSGSTNVGASLPIPTHQFLLIILGITRAHGCNLPHHHAVLYCCSLLLHTPTIVTSAAEAKVQDRFPRHYCPPLPFLHFSLRWITSGSFHQVPWHLK